MCLKSVILKKLLISVWMYKAGLFCTPMSRAPVALSFITSNTGFRYYLSQERLHLYILRVLFLGTYVKIHSRLSLPWSDLCPLAWYHLKILVSNDVMPHVCHWVWPTPRSDATACVVLWIQHFPLGYSDAKRAMLWNYSRLQISAIL